MHQLGQHLAHLLGRGAAAKVAIGMVFACLGIGGVFKALAGLGPATGRGNGQIKFMVIQRLGKKIKRAQFQRPLHIMFGAIARQENPFRLAVGLSCFCQKIQAIAIGQIHIGQHNGRAMPDFKDQAARIGQVGR